MSEIFKDVKDLSGIMAGWITSGITGYINGFVGQAVSGAGTVAGDAVAGVGNGINGVGRGVEGMIRNYGDATKDYGNAIKDWTGGDVGRAGTSGNPLGLSDTKDGGKRAFNHRATGFTTPKKKALPAAPQPKALPAAPSQAKKAPVKASTTKSPLNTAQRSAYPSTSAPARALPKPKTTPAPESKPTYSAPTSGDIPKSSGGGRGKMTGAERRKAAAKAGSSTPRFTPRKEYQPGKGASNPLGL